MRWLFIDLRAGLWCVAGMALLAAGGCGANASGRHRVSGTVTFDGRPLPVGEIYFEPDASQGNVGPTGFASIREGRYDTAGMPPGKGAIAGPQRVRINGYEVPTAPTPSAPEPVGVVLFRDYSATITLPAAASTQDFAVPKTAGDRR